MPHRALSATTTRRRLWQAFLGGRALVAWVLLGLLALQAWGLPQVPRIATVSWLLTGSYVAICSLTWLLARQRPPPPRLHWAWLWVIGVDVVVFFGLQVLHAQSLHSTSLMALPILMAATLGRLRLALATTSAITVLMLAWSASSLWRGEDDSPTQYLPTALTCAAYFLLTYLSYLLAQRLAREERRAHAHQQQAHTQTQVNGLIIEHLSEGVLVVDAHHFIHMANPAACQLLDCTALHSLAQAPAWAPLCELVQRSFDQQLALRAEVNLHTGLTAPLGLAVRTWLTPAPQHGAAPAAPQHTRLCVVFLDDLREAQARLRTEKMAAMGRMSAAVAHEIRNPLAAITQANALLGEELNAPHQQRLSRMVQHNAERLARIAEEVLDIARVPEQPLLQHAPAVALDAQIGVLWQEWCALAPQERQGLLTTGCPQAIVTFDSEHLRRVLVNLLDNALRHASGYSDALQVSTGQRAGHNAWLQVWSEGPRIDASVERHLFEPFFSSNSRSSGLGLYLCRELCQRYHASVHYQRLHRPTARGVREGNAFTIAFRTAEQSTASASRPQPIVL